MQVRTAIISAAIVAAIWVGWSAERSSEGEHKSADAAIKSNNTVQSTNTVSSNNIVQTSDPVKTDTEIKTGGDPKTEAEKAALMKVMKDAVAARHGGVLPKTMSESDANVAAQAAIKWKQKQAAENAKRDLEAMKVKPPPSSGYAEILLAKEAITKMMRDPDSAVFSDVFFVNDRKSATGYYVPVVCGSVNGRNGFGYDRPKALRGCHV